MKLRCSSVPLMLDCIAEHRSPAGLLGHPDYRFELSRYGISDTGPLDFYFNNIYNISPDDIPDLSDKRRDELKRKHDMWLDCITNPDKYRTRFEQLTAVLSDDNLAAMTGQLKSAFPPDADIGIDDAEIIVTLSFGNSFGYVYGNALHIDLFGIDRYCTVAELYTIVMHELHHLMIQKLIGDFKQFTAGFTMLDDYIFRFSGEGLAVKFANNAEGVLSRRINPELAANIGLTSMDVLNRHFEEHLSLFKETVGRINSGGISYDEMNRQFRDYWWNPKLYAEEVPMLDQTPIYSFGNELYGAVYDRFGLDTMFGCFRKPSMLYDYLFGA